jgi:Fic family protein
MKRKIQGRYEVVSTAGENVRAFVPAPLPPKPGIDWTPGLRGHFDDALIALGRLDAVSMLLPDTRLFLYTHVRKEAVLSSMIEGTQSSLSDLLAFEMEREPGVPLDDVREVSSYVAALDHGLSRLRGGFPLSLRLLREIHRVLLSTVRGAPQDPGEFRRSQNWIGGTRPGNAAFVPPPPDKVKECMASLELFLHDRPTATPPLLKAALAHVQFETIHPFLDGNGRLGRLLVTLLLCASGVLREPILYLSLYFKTHRQAYYEHLNAVRLTGDWEAWLAFFAVAVATTADQAVAASRELHELTSGDRDRIASIGRAASTALRVHRVLMERPIASGGWLVERTGITAATVNKALSHLERLGVVRELSGRKRNRLFGYARYVEVVSRGTELPPG